MGKKLKHEVKKPCYYYFFKNKSWLILTGDVLPQVTLLFWYVSPLRNTT